MSEYKVRLATIYDLHTIVDVWFRGIENSLGTQPPEGHDYVNYFGKRILDQDKKFCFFVVEYENQIVGWLSLSPFRSNPALQGLMAEMSAYVEPEFIGKGVSSKGFEYVLNHADNSGLRYVVAFTLENNTGALKLTDKFGFKRIGTFPQNCVDINATPIVYLVRACQPNLVQRIVKQIDQK